MDTNNLHSCEFVSIREIRGNASGMCLRSGCPGSVLPFGEFKHPIRGKTSCTKTKALRRHGQKNAVTAQGRRKILPTADRVDRSLPADSLVSLIPVVLLLNGPQPNGVDDDDGLGLRAQELPKDLDQGMA